MINIVRFSIQKSILPGILYFSNRMNTDCSGLDQKAQDLEGEKYLEKSDQGWINIWLIWGKVRERSSREMIRKGRITVNEYDHKKPETKKIKKGEDTIYLDNAPVEYVELEYYLLNKPQGCDLPRRRTAAQETVVDLIDRKEQKDLFPVGRLDIDTEGLLLITNDGALAPSSPPGHHVDKVYGRDVRACPGRGSAEVPGRNNACGRDFPVCLLGAGDLKRGRTGGTGRQGQRRRSLKYGSRFTREIPSG